MTNYIENKKIFLNEVYPLETTKEKIRLQTEEQAISLLDRYYTSKPRSLVLKK